jgi:hypothetical protein
MAWVLSLPTNKFFQISLKNPVLESTNEHIKILRERDSRSTLLLFNKENTCIDFKHDIIFKYDIHFESSYTDYTSDKYNLIEYYPFIVPMKLKSKLTSHTYNPYYDSIKVNVFEHFSDDKYIQNLRVVQNVSLFHIEDFEISKDNLLTIQGTFMDQNSDDFTDSRINQLCVNLLYESLNTNN